MHLLFYRLRPEVQAVCHAHPPTATGFAAAGRALDEAVLPEVIVDLGTIPLAPYGTPGTWELCESLEPLVAEHDAILLENHGVVTCARYNYSLSTAGNCGTIRADLAYGPFAGRTACALSRKRAETNRCTAALRSAASWRRHGNAAHGRIPGRQKHCDAENSSHALTRLH